MRSTAQQRQLERRQRVEELLRTGEYTAAQLALELRYSLPATRELLIDLLGRDRAERRVFISSWEVSRGVVRITRLPRYRWRTGAQMDARQPTLAECRAILSACSATRPPSSPPVVLAQDPLLGALFAHRLAGPGQSAPGAASA